MTKKKSERKRRAPRQILNDTPHPDSLFASARARFEEIDYSRVVTHPREARKIGTDLTR